MALIGQPVPGNVEGIGFAQVFANSDAPPVRDAVFSIFYGSDSRSIRTDRYKFIRNFSPRRMIDAPINMTIFSGAIIYDFLGRRMIDTPINATNPPKPHLKQPVAQLYDLENDPNEFDDVARNPEYREIYNTLSQRLWQWMEDVNDPTLKSPIPTPYYWEAMADYRP